MDTELYRAATLIGRNATLRIAYGDGRRVMLRPIGPQDGEQSQAFVRGLSQSSRYRRFLGALNELTPSMLERFTHVDYRNQLALVAETFADDGKPVLIGEARYVADRDRRSAEFALAVADAWQGQGLGALLLESLLRSARAGGVRHLYGDVLNDNGPMLNLARRAGFAIGAHPEDPGLVRVTIDLVALLQAAVGAQRALGAPTRRQGVDRVTEYGGWVATPAPMGRVALRLVP